MGNFQKQRVRLSLTTLLHVANGGENTQKKCAKKIFMTQLITMGDHWPKPDILEGEVKWALGSITTNKASGSDGIPVQLF